MHLHLTNRMGWRHLSHLWFSLGLCRNGRFMHGRTCIVPLPSGGVVWIEMGD